MLVKLSDFQPGTLDFKSSYDDDHITNSNHQNITLNRFYDQANNQIKPLNKYLQPKEQITNEYYIKKIRDYNYKSKYEPVNIQHRTSYNTNTKNRYISTGQHLRNKTLILNSNRRRRDVEYSDKSSFDMFLINQSESFHTGREEIKNYIEKQKNKKKGFTLNYNPRLKHYNEDDKAIPKRSPIYYAKTQNELLNSGNYTVLNIWYLSHGKNFERYAKMQQKDRILLLNSIRHRKELIEEEVTDIFKSLDTDESGYVDFKEYKHMRYFADGKTNLTALRLEFRQMDLLRHGRINLVSFLKNYTYYFEQAAIILEKTRYTHYE